MVEGGKRYWLHPLDRGFRVAGIPIDRFDKTIVGQLLEEVTE
jgi:hypothetical protein